jgi:hypothetical protein
VDDARSAGPELGRHDPGVLRDVGLEDEGAVDVGALRRDLVRLGHLDDEVRLAERPATGEGGDGRRLRRVALGHARLDPGAEDSDLAHGETSLILEVPDPLGRVPGRHVARLGHGRRGLRVLLRLGVVREREGRDAACPVAGDAVRVEDRRDVPGVGRTLRDLPLVRALEDAAHGLGRRRGERLPVVERRERVGEVLVPRVLALLPELLPAVVDPAPVDDLAITDDEGLGRHARLEARGELAVRIEHERELRLVLLLVLDELRPGEGRVGEDAVEDDVLVGLRDLVELGDVLVRDRALGIEEDDDARPGLVADHVDRAFEVEDVCRGEGPERGYVIRAGASGDREKKRRGSKTVSYVHGLLYAAVYRGDS